MKLVFPRHLKKILPALVLAVATVAQASVISPLDYSLTAITGTWAYGQTNWNDIAGAGAVNNGADLATVENLLSNGYVASAASGTVNGIYSAYPGFGVDSLTFNFNGGADYDVTDLSFLSSRSYSNTTILTFEYSLDGGAWQLGASTTSGALGIGTGAANWYSLFAGSVTLDAFRLTFVSSGVGGSQVSLHELELQGSSAVPEAGNTLGLLGLGLAGFALLRRKFVR